MSPLQAAPGSVQQPERLTALFARLFGNTPEPRRQREDIFTRLFGESPVRQMETHGNAMAAVEDAAMELAALLQNQVQLGTPPAPKTVDDLPSIPRTPDIHQLPPTPGRSIPGLFAPTPPPRDEKLRRSESMLLTEACPSSTRVFKRKHNRRHARKTRRTFRLHFGNGLLRMTPIEAAELGIYPIY